MAGKRKAESGLRPLTTADMAICLNTSANNIGQLVRQQVLLRNEQGLFDPQINFPAYLKHNAEGLRSKWAADAQGKTRLADAKASMAEIELLRQRHEMVAVSLVGPAIEAMVMKCRSRLLAIPSRLAPRLVTAKSAVEAQAMIKEEIDAALTELSRLPNVDGVDQQAREVEANDEV